MTKGAVLIGCGFVPNEIDVYRAIWQDCLKNCHIITTLGFESCIQIDAALTTYVQIAREQGWDDPIGLQARQFTTKEGQRVWSVWPMA